MPSLRIPTIMGYIMRERHYLAIIAPIIQMQGAIGHKHPPVIISSMVIVRIDIEVAPTCRLRIAVGIYCVIIRCITPNWCAVIILHIVIQAKPHRYAAAIMHTKFGVYFHALLIIKPLIVIDPNLFERHTLRT